MKKDYICDLAVSHWMVNPDGNVYPCCNAWCNNYSFGNIFEQDINSIINSDKAKEFRKSVFNKEYKYCNLHKCNMPRCSDSKLEKMCKSDGTALMLPQRVKLGTDEHCNIRCITCRDELIVNSPEKTKMLDAMIETHFLPLLENADMVTLSPSGEALASRHSRKLIKEISKKYPYIKFGIHTNGILCDEKNCTDLGILDRIDNVQVSVSAVNKETYDKIMRGADYERVWNNIEWLAKLKKEGKIADISLIFVVQAMNYHEMKLFAQRASNLNINAAFWKYDPAPDTQMKKEADKYFVWEPSHPEYNNFINIISNPVFDLLCIWLPPEFKKMRKQRFRDKLFNITKTYTRLIITVLGIKIKLKRR
jgi:radical SAM protein with 4Fe4S-binding SPASM domain